MWKILSGRSMAGTLYAKTPRTPRKENIFVAEGLRWAERQGILLRQDAKDAKKSGRFGFAAEEDSGKEKELEGEEDSEAGEKGEGFLDLKECDGEAGGLVHEMLINIVRDIGADHVELVDQDRIDHENPEHNTEPRRARVGQERHERDRGEEEARAVGGHVTDPRDRDEVRESKQENGEGGKRKPEAVGGLGVASAGATGIEILLDVEPCAEREKQKERHQRNDAFVGVKQQREDAVGAEQDHAEIRAGVKLAVRAEGVRGAERSAETGGVIGKQGEDRYKVADGGKEK